MSILILIALLLLIFGSIFNTYRDIKYYKNTISRHEKYQKIEKVETKDEKTE